MEQQNRPHSDSEQVHSLAEQIKQSVRLLQEQHPDESNNSSDALLFVGNWQDAIPRAIWTDPILEAIDVRVWGFIRSFTVSQCAAVFPSYQLIASQLNIARPTVSRAIQILRACRWLTLCSSARDQHGQFRGNIYALHDEPITLHDGMHLDPHYLRFVQKLESHHHRRVKRIATAVLATIKERIGHGEDPLKEMGTVSRFNANAHGDSFAVSKHRVQYLNPGEPNQVQNLNLDQNDRVQILNSANQNEEYQALNIQVQKLNSVPCSSRCSSSFINKSTTTFSDDSARAKALDDLVFPTMLSRDECELAFIYLQSVAENDRQALLDELAAQIRSKTSTANPIRNPIGYLSWMCEQLESGKRPLTSLGVKNRQLRERQDRQRAELEKEQKRITDDARQQKNTSLTERLGQIANTRSRKKEQ